MCGMRKAGKELSHTGDSGDTLRIFPACMGQRTSHEFQSYIVLLKLMLHEIQHKIFYLAFHF